jgi:hypothetical protein
MANRGGSSAGGNYGGGAGNPFPSAGRGGAQPPMNNNFAGSGVGSGA